MSELRNYVLEKFASGKEYTKTEINKFVDEEFGQGKYSSKQLQNLLYNLTKQKKIERTVNHGYKLTEENQLDDIVFTIEQHITQLRKMCIYVNDELNKKDFLERYKGINLNILSQVYYMNKKILKDISECEKKIKSGTSDRISYEKRKEAEVERTGM